MKLIYGRIEDLKAKFARFAVMMTCYCLETRKLFLRFLMKRCEKKASQQFYYQ
jgi:hypothetical protein